MDGSVVWLHILLGPYWRVCGALCRMRIFTAFPAPRFYRKHVYPVPALSRPLPVYLSHHHSIILLFYSILRASRLYFCMTLFCNSFCSLTSFRRLAQNCENRLLASSCLSVLLSVWNNSAPTGQISMKFDI